MGPDLIPYNELYMATPAEDTRIVLFQHPGTVIGCLRLNRTSQPISDAL